MANSEASFKREFKEALEKEYGPKAAIWSHTDMMRSGLPDLGAHFDGTFYPIEAKFAESIPKKKSSLILTRHKLTSGQAAFLRHIQTTGGCPIVLIGFPDVAIAVPYNQWPCFSPGGLLESDITLEWLLKIRDRGGLAFEKARTGWDVRKFFELTRHVNMGPVL